MIQGLKITYLNLSVTYRVNYGLNLEKNGDGGTESVIKGLMFGVGDEN